MSCGCFDVACESYAKLGVDVKKAMASLDKIAISMHCWQGDDVAGFESAEALSGGIQVTGHHPGKARNAEELRKDIDMALSLIPGCHRINLHAIYAESNGKKMDRDALDISHFQSWVDWAKARGLKLDFNPTYFSHPKAKGDLTLSSSDEEVRKFWIAHGQACRRIAAEFGKQLGSAAVCNQWIPDGSKDTPADRLAPRQRLIDSLDQVFAEDFSNELLVDAVECKLFGIGSESYVVGSHEFYMGYAMKNNKAVCLDAGHFHPTEKIADKISALLCFSNEVLLHVSRGVRWDSDHVIVLNDDLLDIAGEIVRHNFQDRVHIGLDYFDGSINRIAAWVIGMRNMQKALLMALLEPTAKLREFELNGDFASRLALMEEMRTMPFSAVWNQYCAMHNVPGGFQWMDQVNAYDRDVLSCRN